MEKLMKAESSEKSIRHSVALFSLIEQLPLQTHTGKKKKKKRYSSLTNQSYNYNQYGKTVMAIKPGQSFAPFHLFIVAHTMASSRAFVHSDNKCS